ncbi:type IV secretory system conjugative DNA transfer family protein [Nocardioidaceae bacterium]|nr:type IV secretory system conjugative DNA transfer family protein [Nocardioidaceae bacterium]
MTSPRAAGPATSPLSLDPRESVTGILLALGGLVLVGGAAAYAAALAAHSLTGGGRATASSEHLAEYLGGLATTGSLDGAWRAAYDVTPPATWATAGLLLVLVSLLAVGVWGVSLLRGRFTAGHSGGRSCGEAEAAAWATAKDEKRLTVPRDPADRPFRLVAGRSRTTKRLLAAEDCISAVAFGPNGSGKTAGLILPNTIEWAGSVVMTTAKPQDLTAVLAAHAGRRTWVIAPGGAPGVPTAGWSPVDYAEDPETADRMAGWMVDASGMTGDVRARPWNAQARKYLKGLLLAANVSGRGISGFVEWAYDGELASAEVGEILEQAGHDEALREYRSTWRIHEEGKGSVMFTAFGLADTYNRPGVRQACSRSDLTPADLLGPEPAMLLLVTPQSEVERFTPYFTALLSAIVHEAETRAAHTGGPVNPRLLLALDEAGNVFRYPRLPHLLTTARGNGVQLLLAYHDIAQIEHLYGGRDVARTVLSNAKMRLLLPGVGDIDTLRYFSDLLGHTTVGAVSRQTGPDGRRSSSETDHREALAPVHLLQQLPAGHAVLVYENLPGTRVTLRMWFRDRRLRSLVRPLDQKPSSTAISTPRRPGEAA